MGSSAIFVALFFGLVIGVVARAIVPGAPKIGVIKTSLLGIGGLIFAFYGGAAIGLFSTPSGSRSLLANFIVGVIGAALLLFIYMRLPKALTKKRSLFRSSEQVESTTQPPKENGLGEK